MSERNFTLSIAAQPLTRLTEFDPEDEYRPEPEPEAVPPAWLDGSVRIGIHTSIAGGTGTRWKRRGSWGATRCRYFRRIRGSGRAGRRGFRKWMRRSFGRCGRNPGWGRWLFMQII